MHPLLQTIVSSSDINEQLKTSYQQSDYKCKAISFINPYSYKHLRGNQEHFKNIDFFYSDGIMSCKIFQLFFKRKFPRVSFDFSSFATTFFNVAEQQALPIFLLGSKQSEIEAAVEKIKQAYPSINLKGFRNGYFNDDKEVINEIKESGAKYVICGLGTPKQDDFIQKLKTALPEQLKQVYTCGGFLHQTAVGVQYYPPIMDKLNLRWLYRAVNERVVLKRLMVEYPAFIFIFLKDRYFYRP